MSVYQGSQQIVGGTKVYSAAPIGSIMDYLGDTTPVGYLKCNGQTVEKTKYPELYDIIGDKYNGTSTVEETMFSLPNIADKNLGTEDNPVTAMYIIKAKNFHMPGDAEVNIDDSDYVKKNEIVNNQTTTEKDFALDARQANPDVAGTLAAQLSSLNDRLINYTFDGSINPLTKTLTKNSIYIVYTYGNHGDEQYTAVWLAMTGNTSILIIMPLFGGYGDSQITHSGLTITVSSSSTLTMGVVRLGSRDGVTD